MASQQRIVGFVVDQMAAAGTVSARQMFGEYGIYCDGKMVALFCDDQLFVKPTKGGKALLGSVTEAPPYPGAKPCLLIAEEDWEDGEALSALIRITAAELPVPVKKPRKKI